MVHCWQQAGFDGPAPKPYRFEGEDSVRHLFAAAGLESFVLGERQVAGAAASLYGARRPAQLLDLERARVVVGSVALQRRAAHGVESAGVSCLRSRRSVVGADSTLGSGSSVWARSVSVVHLFAQRGTRSSATIAPRVFGGRCRSRRSRSTASSSTRWWWRRGRSPPGSSAPTLALSCRSSSISAHRNRSQPRSPMLRRPSISMRCSSDSAQSISTVARRSKARSSSGLRTFGSARTGAACAMSSSRTSGPTRSSPTRACPRRSKDSVRSTRRRSRRRCARSFATTAAPCCARSRTHQRRARRRP